jgi:hypothetical protein
VSNSHSSPPETDADIFARRLRKARLSMERPQLDHSETRLRARFGPAAWRVLCRSPHSTFGPILRNRDLDIDRLAR